MDPLPKSWILFREPWNLTKVTATLFDQGRSLSLLLEEGLTLIKWTTRGPTRVTERTQWNTYKRPHSCWGSVRCWLIKSCPSTCMAMTLQNSKVPKSWNTFTHAISSLRVLPTSQEWSSRIKLVSHPGLYLGHHTHLIFQLSTVHWSPNRQPHQYSLHNGACCLHSLSIMVSLKWPQTWKTWPSDRKRNHHSLSWLELKVRTSLPSLPWKSSLSSKCRILLRRKVVKSP